MDDIGSHWFDMTEHLTNRRVSALSADLQIFHKIRKWPKVGIETFAGTRLQSEDYDLVPMDTEDFGAVTSGVGERTRGPVTASQLSRGQKNRLRIEIHGSKCFLMWDQERPDELWIGYRNTNNQILVKDPSLLRDHTRAYPDLNGAHSEGYYDIFTQASAASTARSQTVYRSWDILSSETGCGNYTSSKPEWRAAGSKVGWR